MRVLAFASQKSGAGKTTLAGHMAAQARDRGAESVALIDVDPEAHLADWCAKRAGQPFKFARATQADLLQKIEALRAEGTDLVIIDTPPALGQSIDAALQVADLVAIPTRPYAHDMEAASATAEMARRAGKPFVFVVNNVQGEAELPPDLVMGLAQHGPVATTAIPRDLAFVESMNDGRTVMEIGADTAPARNVDNLWKYLSAKLKKGGRAKAASPSAPAADAQGDLLTARKKSPRRRTAAAAPTAMPASEADAAPADVTAAPAGGLAAVAPAPQVAAAGRPLRAAMRTNPQMADAPALTAPPPKSGGRMRRLRIAAFAALGIVGVAVAGGIAAINSIDPATYAGLIESAVEDATGRQLTIAGGIEVALGFTPGVRIEDVTLSNAAWASEPNMAAVKRLDVQIKLLPLLFGDVEIKRIILIGADLQLQRSADGKANWTFDDGKQEAAPAAEAGGEVALPAVHQIRIQDSRIVYQDAATTERREVLIDRLRLISVGLSQVLEFELDSALDGQPLAAKGEIDNLPALIAGDDLGLDVTVELGTARVALVGRIAAPYFLSDIDLKLDGSGASLADLGHPFGVALAERGPFKIAGALAGDGKQYRIDGLEARVADSDLAGNATLDLQGARPVFTGDLRSERLDLDDVIADSPPPAGPDDGRIFSDDDIPFEAIGLADGTLSVAAKSVVSNSVTMSDLAGRLVLADGVATLSPFTAILKEGKVDLTASVNATDKQPIVKVRGHANGMSGDALLGALGLDGVLGGGTADLALDLAGRGRSLRDLMASLGGGAHLHMTGGYVADGFARFLLADMTQMMSSGGGGASVNCLVTAFDAKNGIATSRQTVIDASGAAIVGSGRINLGKETIAMRFEPVAKQIGLSQFAIPVDVTGALASPSVTPDALTGAGNVVGSTATLATDNVLGAIAGVTGLDTGKTSAALPSCGAPGTLPKATAPTQDAAVDESEPAAPAPAASTATAGTKKKKSASGTASSSSSASSSSGSSSGGTLDSIGDFLNDVSDSIGSSSSPSQPTSKNNK
jgi:uncharacterized protein involved in outer membrane biogenesis/cellulose biosynthesis protein BcsQ